MIWSRGSRHWRHRSNRARLGTGANIGVKTDIIGNGAVSQFSCNGSGTSKSSTSSGIVRICTTEASSALRVELDAFFVASISMHRADITGWYLSL
jgi:hypothetical protein